MRISGKLLLLIKSFLNNIYQRVILNDQYSDQGSIQASVNEWSQYKYIQKDWKRWEIFLAF